MKRVWGFGREKGLSPLGSASGLQRQGRGVRQENNRTDNLLLGYHVRDRDLRKIHKAACVGNVAQVQQILLLGENGVDDRDKMNRTALHLACANGHPEVVTLLVERKCHLNLCDHEKRTALMKAVQCQEEECVNILLENGADPNIRDVSGNTALHYAAFGDNISIIEKLLLYNANTEARNKDNFTPLLVAVNENKQQIVEVLGEKAANIHAEDKLKRTAFMLAVNYDATNVVRLLLQQGIDPFPHDVYGWATDEYANIKGFNLSDEIICHHKEEIMLKNSLQSSNPGTDKNAEEDSITRLSGKPGPDDSWPTSASQDFDFDTKVEEKKKHRGSDMEVSENIHDAAVAGLIPQRQNGKADNHQLPITEKKDSDRSEPGLHRKKLKEGENEKGTSKGSVITPVLKKADSLTGGPLQKNDGSHFSEKDQHESRPAKKISKKKNKVKKQITSKDDLVDFIQSSETASEDCGLPYSKNFTLLTEQLGMDCKGTDKNAEEDSITRLSGKPGPDDSWPTSTSQDFDFDTKEGTAKSAMEAKQDGVGIIENVPPEQTLNDSLTSAGGVHKNYRSDMMSALELGEEEDVESPSLPEVEEKKKHRGSDMEVSENIHDAAVAGLIPQRQNGKADNHQLPITEKKDSDRSEPGLHRKKLKEGENEKGTSKGSVITPVLKKADSLTGGPLQKNDGSHFSEKDQHESRPAKKISKKKNKVKKQITSKDDLVDFIQSSETASEDCGLPYSKNFMLLIEQLGMDCKDSAGFLKIQNILVSYKRLRKLNKNHCKRVTGKIKKMEKTVSALQNELREAKDVTSRLEHQKVEWEHEVCSLRFSLKQEEEKRRNADLLYEKSREKLRRIEDQYKKEVETKQEFELALRTRNMELKAAKDNLNQLSDSREEIQDLLHKNHMLQDEIAMLRLERDTIKNQNQRKETKYCEDIESVKEKNDNLQKTIKQNEETLSKTIFRYSGQLNVLTAEITMLKSKLENEKQNKESLEAEVESYRARLATAVHNHDQSQTSRRDLELAFQRARDEDGHLQDQMNVDVSKLQDKNEVLSRQLSQDESKFNALEIELHHTKDALREKTLVLECVQRDLSQTQCQKMEIERMYQKEQSNMNKYIAKQESFEERLSQLQSENMLLRQQLDAAHNQADSEEKLVIDMQDQFQNIPKYLKAKREEQGLMLGERNKELTDECKHLKERMYKYKNEKKKLEVVVRELQQKLADTLKKQSMSHASPEVVSHLRLEDETRDLKKKLGRIRSQADVLTTELETTSSKCLHLDAKNQILQQELLSMKAFEEEREKLESNNKKLQREVVNLKQFMEMNMVERSQVEQYKREIEERARLDTVQKLHEVNLFLQAQAAAQENLDQLRENAHASTRSQMELRIKDLESQVSTVKTSQDSTKTELETYRQLYLEELKVRKSLRSELNRTNERLSESNTKLLAERQQHQTSLRTLTMSLGLETPYCGHFGNNSVLNGNLTPRRNLVIPTLNPRPSYAYWETSLWKMQRELEKGVTRALEEVAPEFERGSCRTPLVSTDDSILNQDPVWKASREYVQILNKKYMI